MTSGQADSWCAIGLVMPEGTKLKFRFHIGPELRKAFLAREFDSLNQLTQPGHPTAVTVSNARLKWQKWKQLGDHIWETVGENLGDN